MGLRVPVSVLLAMLCAVACEDNPAITSTATAPTTTQNFSDTIGVNGGKTYQFSSTARGTVTATLTSLVPEGTVIGLSVGTWNGLFCQQVWVKDDATQGAAVSGTVSGVGNLCLRMYDSGQLTQPATYSVDVTHP